MSHGFEQQDIDSGKVLYELIDRVFSEGIPGRRTVMPPWGNDAEPGTLDINEKVIWREIAYRFAQHIEETRQEPIPF